MKFANPEIRRGPTSGVVAALAIIVLLLPVNNAAWSAEASGAGTPTRGPSKTVRFGFSAAGHYLPYVGGRLRSQWDGRDDIKGHFRATGGGVGLQGFFDYFIPVDSGFFSGSFVHFELVAPQISFLDAQVDFGGQRGTDVFSEQSTRLHEQRFEMDLLAVDVGAGFGKQIAAWATRLLSPYWLVAAKYHTGQVGYASRTLQDLHEKKCPPAGDCDYEPDEFVTYRGWGLGGELGVDLRFATILFAGAGLRLDLVGTTGEREFSAVFVPITFSLRGGFFF